MSRTVLIVPALLLLATSAMPVHAAQGTPPVAAPRLTSAPPSAGSQPAFASDRVIVRWKDPSKAAQRASAHHAVEVASLATPSHSVLRTQGRPVDVVIDELRHDPNVAWAERDYVVHVEDGGTQAVAVNDPMTDDQYALDRMRVRDAWTRSTGGAALIAVLDTGVQFTHPDLAGRVVAGYDFVNGDTDARDDNGHGTWVTGILVAKANNAVGVAGISWSDKVLPVKVMNSSGIGYTSDLAAGIYYAADRGAKVINMSVGGFPNLQSVGDAVDYAWAKGVVLVAAAGNHGVNERSYPASYPHVVSVSATQADDEFTNWSSYGSAVDVSAPGAAITTTDCGGCSVSSAGSPRYGAISGTSFATPNTAGVVALIAAEYPTATNAWIVDRLTSTTDDLGTVGRDDHYGTGRVNAYRALGASVTRVAPPPGDGYEPNQTVATARRLGLGTTHRPTNYPAGDVDLFAFDVPSAGKLTVTVTAVVDNTRPLKSSLPFDPVLELLASDGVSRLAWTDGPYSPDTETATSTVPAASRIYARVTNWFPNGTTVAYSIRGAFVDEIRPGIMKVTPAPDATMVPASSDLTVGFSEPVSGVNAATIGLFRGSAPIAGSVRYDASTQTAVLTPSEPLPTDAVLTARVASGITDLGGNALPASSWSFSTSPGQAFESWRRVTFAAGTYVGYRLDGSGRILATRSARLGRASGASTSQRSTLASMPGRWLYIENGLWAGYWVPESAGSHIAGETERETYGSAPRMAFAAGTHVGYVFDAAGGVVRSRSYRLTRASGANAQARAIINGRAYLLVQNGVWAGYWIRESAAVHRPGFVGRMNFALHRRMEIGAGSYTGYAFDSAGTITGSRTASLSRTSGADASAWAVVNGREYFLVANGIWAGQWLPTSAVVRLQR